MADKNGTSSANLGLEDKLWKAADALRSNMDAAEYKHVVLGLIFLKYISDTFEEQHARLEAEHDQGADPEDPDEYRAANTFWVPKEARWAFLLASAKQPTIGKTVDGAMLAVKRDNPSLKGDVADRLRCAVPAHDVRGQADARAWVDAGHRARQPRLQGQARRAGRGLPGTGRRAPATRWRFTPKAAARARPHWIRNRRSRS